MNIDTPNNTYLVIGNRPWNHQIFIDTISHFPGQWHFIATQEQLALAKVQTLQPRYLFFLHWSWKVPKELTDHYECVCFHLTEVPYGRGGSPLQNLIMRGHRQTKLTALRMVQDFDAGPVYFREDLCLEGNAEEIYIRATHLSAQLIKRIIQERPEPTPQTGEAVIFQRRKPNESDIPELSGLPALHDFIRMLDAEGYPKAFLKYQGFRYEFSRAALYNGRIVADVTITPLEETDK